KMLRALLGWNEKELAKKNQEVLFYWDQDGVPGDLKVIQSTDPHDLSLSRKRWQFAQRREHMGQMAAAKTEG
ncbi:MAG: hypothetical protein OEW12_10450, partial [Deltaproteobacteria bacterium]|nr:hypothetical protein [Deltaproteobacteria bacterium]